MEKDYTFNYQLLSRLKIDCDYYLGYGNRNEKQLWAKSEEEQIKKMYELYDSFPANLKPEWLNVKDLKNYKEKIIGEEKVSDELKTLINRVEAKEDIKKLDKLYRQVSDLEVSNGSIYIVLDTMQDKINNEIIKLQKENNISYEEFKEISDLNEKDKRDNRNIKILAEDRLNNLFENCSTKEIEETLDGFGFTKDEILEQFGEDNLLKKEVKSILEEAIKDEEEEGEGI